MGDYKHFEKQDQSLPWLVIMGGRKTQEVLKQQYIETKISTFRIIFCLF